MSEQDAIQSEAAETRAEIKHAADIRVGAEAKTYRSDAEFDFFADAINSKHDRAAAERIERNRIEMAHEYRANGTSGDFGGLVVPQYLVDQFAPVLVSGRPFLSAVTQVPLPDSGMNLTIPRGSTGTSVAAQTTENTSVSNTSYVESDLVVPVRTFAGQQVVSRQSIERGTGIAQILLADLFQQYATKVNVSAISGDGTAGSHYGILNTTSVATVAWTGTTGASFVTSLHKAIGTIAGARYAAPDLIVMHPRRWAWLCAQSDTSNRPLVQIDGPGFNAVGNGVAAGYGGVGSIAGIKVVTDAGVPTNLGGGTEDRVIVTRSADILFMEAAGAPVGLTLEEVLADQLSVRMVTYSFSAFTAARYTSASAVMVGTGLTNVL